MNAPSDHKMAQLFASGAKGGALAKQMEEYGDAKAQEARESMAREVIQDLEQCDVVLSAEHEAKMKEYLVRFRKEVSEVVPHSKQENLLTMAIELETFIKDLHDRQAVEKQFLDEVLEGLNDECS